MQYREQMSDFFSKRGRSWLISAVIINQGRIGTEVKWNAVFTFSIVAHRTVLSVIENLLQTIKVEYPSVNNALSVLYWFCQEPVGFMCDIESMFLT